MHTRFDLAQSVIRSMIKYIDDNSGNEQHLQNARAALDQLVILDREVHNRTGQHPNGKIITPPWLEMIDRLEDINHQMEKCADRVVNMRLQVDKELQRLKSGRA